MSQQVWTTKQALDLEVGDLIPSPSQRVAVVVRQGNTVIVHCSTDVYRRLPPEEYRMENGKQIPVAVSGVAYLDQITTQR